MDYLELIKESRKIKANDRKFPEVKIAVLGDNSTQSLVQTLRALLFRHQVYAVCHESEFNVIDQETLNPDSALYQFLATHVVLFPCTQQLREKFYSRPRPEPQPFIDETIEQIQRWWDAIGSRSKARIIHHVFVLPLERPFGNYTLKMEQAFLSIMHQINRRLIDLSKGYGNVFLNDLEYTASLIGKKQWLDETWWVQAKLACHPECVPQVAQGIADIVRASLGQIKKCLVLDLDNTLWGGIIGEDGVEGIEVGPEGAGEAYLQFQRYLLELKNRGLILAVCSKNDTENAVAPFRHHPHMALKEEDFAVFTANWNNKVDNIRDIAATLNIGLDSMVFIDDSSFERNHVRTALPEVFVPEMPEDPADFVKYLTLANCFETVSFSAEDRTRTEQYRRQAQRETVRTKFTDINGYLASLEMKAVFNRFDAFHLPRIVQLIGRSNQFNLTTKRYSEKECEALAADQKSYFPIYITLEDKYGDSGLISVIILQSAKTKLVIDTWLMSCRVLERGLEQFAMNQVVALVKSKGFTTIEGMYLPTAKNKMVADFYERFGFRRVEGGDNGKTVWAINVDDYRPQHTLIQLKQEDLWPAGKS